MFLVKSIRDKNGLYIENTDSYSNKIAARITEDLVSKIRDKNLPYIEYTDSYSKKLQRKKTKNVVK